MKTKALKEPPVYQERTYRKLHSGTWGAVFRVVVEETDLWICADRELGQEAEALVRRFRQEVLAAEALCPGFLRRLEPLEGDMGSPMVRKMLAAGRAAGVGPMAAVAGAVSEAVAEALLATGRTEEILVENGGDIFLSSREERTVLIQAGDSPFSERVGIRLRGNQFPLGICTSSGTVGHSLSFGKADAAVVLARDAALADAAATTAGNRIQTEADIERTLTFLKGIPGILGAVLIKGEGLGAWGDLELISVRGEENQ